MSLKASIGRYLRDKLGVTALDHQLKDGLRFTQSLAQVAIPEVIIPDDQSLHLSMQRALELYGIRDFDPAIHKNDLMFQHHLAKLPANPAEALFHYYNVGLSSLKGIVDLLKDESQYYSVLDFGSGYGRGSRFMPFFFPKAEIYVSDVKAGAMRFQKKQFGFNTINHTENPKSFRAINFDLIIAISVFSHLPENAFTSWLEVLTGAMTKDAVLFFTYNPLPARDKEDYKFITQSEDAGLSWVTDRLTATTEYGSSFYSETKMRSVLSRFDFEYKIISSFSGTQNAVLLRTDRA